MPQARRAPVGLRRIECITVLTTVIQVFACSCVVAHGLEARVPAAANDIAEVTTARQLQESIRSGVQHVIVNSHIDISILPSLSGHSGPGARVLAIQQNSDGQYTKTIRVRSPSYSVNKILVKYC